MSRSETKFVFFQSALGLDRVDTANGIIHGVAIITSGVQARGHDLHVDGTTLDQMFECAQARGKVPVKFNHQSGVENIGGYLHNFRIKENKLLGDWVLLKSHDQYHTTLEKAKEMPECFGMSAAFMGKESEKGGKKFARCSELMAVDCVVQPAANAGLFEARVDSPADAIMANENSQNTEPTLADVMAQLGQLNTTLQAVNQRIEAVEGFQNEVQSAGIKNALAQLDKADLDELAAMSDEELEAQGVSREFVNEAIAQATESGDLDPAQAQAQAQAGAQGEGSGGGAARGAAEAAPAVAALSAKVDKLIAFEARRQQNEKRVLLEAEQKEFEDTMTTLQAKIVEVTALCSAQAATIKRFEANPNIGPSLERAINFSAENNSGVEQHEFEKLIAKHAAKPGISAGQAVMLAQKENPALHKQYLQRNGVEFSAR